MASSNQSSLPAITLDQLIALNDEIAALVRCGVPLEANLAKIGQDMPGTLGHITTVLANRAHQGQSLPQIISECSANFPPAYRAVIDAGLRAGRLPAALESLSTNIRRLADTRRNIAAAVLYPFLVIIIGCLSFAFFSAKIAPVLAAHFTAFGLPASGAFVVLAWIGQWAIIWGLGLPIILSLVAFLIWHESSKATWIGATGLSLILTKLPVFGPMFTWSRNAAFADVLSILIENSVPMPEALNLAAESSGDPRLIHAAQYSAQLLSSGKSLVSQNGELHEFPPLLRWLLPSTSHKYILVSALKHAAEMYSRRAEHQADLLRIFTPIIMTICISGVITLLYALTLFIPYTTMLKALAH